MIKSLGSLILLLLSSSGLCANYLLVDIVHLTTKQFEGNHENGKVYADISYPACTASSKAEIDFGDYLLGPDCYYGQPQAIEVKQHKHKWRIYLPSCYSGHIYSFSRKVKIYCVS